MFTPDPDSKLYNRTICATVRGVGLRNNLGVTRDSALCPHLNNTTALDWFKYIWLESLFQLSNVIWVSFSKWSCGQRSSNRQFIHMIIFINNSGNTAFLLFQNLGATLKYFINMLTFCFICTLRLSYIKRMNGYVWIYEVCVIRAYTQTSL